MTQQEADTKIKALLDSTNEADHLLALSIAPNFGWTDFDIVKQVLNGPNWNYLSLYNKFYLVITKSFLKHKIAIYFHFDDPSDVQINTFFSLDINFSISTKDESNYQKIKQYSLTFMNKIRQ